MKYIEHNITSWFGDTPLVLTNFFQNDFKTKTLSKFKVPRSVLNQYKFDNTITVQEVLNNIIVSVGNIMIQAIVNSPLAKNILPKLNFGWLEEDTQNLLKQCVCEMIQNASYNNEFWEKTNSSSIQSPTFQANRDSSTWILGSDVFGIFAQNLLKNSGISNYEWQEENLFYNRTLSGNIKVIGYITETTAKELSI